MPGILTPYMTRRPQREAVYLLHLGSGYMVPARTVVLICDAQSIDARAYLSQMRREDRLVRIEPGDKSLIVCQGRHSHTAYLSPIATRTLARRFAAHSSAPAPGSDRISRALPRPLGRAERTLEASND